MKNKIYLLLICLLFPLLNTLQMQAREVELTQVNELEITAKDAPKQSVSSFDIAPLFKAAAKLLSKDRHQIESEMLLTLDSSGGQVISNVKIKTITEAPNKFNSEIAFFSPNGLPGKKYKVLYNGDKVWIYDVNTNKYSISSYQEFTDFKRDWKSNAFFIGIVSRIYLSLHSNFENANIETKSLSSFSDSELISFLESEFNLDREQISLRKETVNNSQYLVYIIGEVKKNFVFELFLDPSSNEVKTISFSNKELLQYGEEVKFNILVKEKINSSIAPLSLSRSTFNFLPPINSNNRKQMIEIFPH